MTEGYLDDDYGHKADHVLTTTLQIRQLKSYDLKKIKSVWLYQTRRPSTKTKIPWDEYENRIKNIYGYYGPIQIINKNIQQWLNFYKENCCKEKLQSSIRYPSKGTAAILTTMSNSDIDMVYAVGFDSVLLNGPPNCLTHNWELEHKILKTASKAHNCKLFALQ